MVLHNLGRTLQSKCSKLETDRQVKLGPIGCLHVNRRINGVVAVAKPKAKNAAGRASMAVLS